MRPMLLVILLLPAGTALAWDNPGEASPKAREDQKADGPVPLDFLKPTDGQERYRWVVGEAGDKDKADGRGDRAAIEIHGEAGQTLTPIVEVRNPPVESHLYVVRGRIKYENVVGDAYIEMWNDFGGRGAYFTRTLGGVGPMRSISGTSGWRDIGLPFTAEPGMKPERITINVVMPGGGTVFLSPLTIETLRDGADSDVRAGGTDSSAWWSPWQAGLVGGIAGSALGVLGAIVGVLAGLRRAQTLVVSLLVAGIGCGACCLLGGLVALCLSQPFFVTYPLLLLGGLATVVLGVNLPTILRRYREEELRKMAALDA